MLEQVTYIVLICMLFAAAIMDICTYKISNRLIAAGMVTGLCLQLLQSQLWGVLSWVTGVAGMIAGLYILYCLSMFGAGDVKLLGMIGGFLGFWQAVYIFVFSLMFGGVIAMVLIVKRHIFFERFRYFFRYLQKISIYIFEKNKNLPRVTDKTEILNHFQYMKMQEKDRKACMHFAVPVLMAVVYIGTRRMMS